MSSPKEQHMSDLKPNFFFNLNRHLYLSAIGCFASSTIFSKRGSPRNEFPNRGFSGFKFELQQAFDFREQSGQMVFDCIPDEQIIDGIVTMNNPVTLGDDAMNIG